jgi:hypothetical protein
MNNGSANKKMYKIEYVDQDGNTDMIYIFGYTEKEIVKLLNKTSVENIDYLISEYH